jgi:hypothetical protein
VQAGVSVLSKEVRFIFFSSSSLPPLDSSFDGRLMVSHPTTTTLSLSPPPPLQKGPLRRSGRPVLKLLTLKEDVLVRPRPRGGQQGHKGAQGASLCPQVARHRRPSRGCRRQGYQGRYPPARVVPCACCLEGDRVRERGTLRICLRL